MSPKKFFPPKKEKEEGIHQEMPIGLKGMNSPTDHHRMSRVILLILIIILINLIINKSQVSCERSWQHLEKRRSANRFLWLPWRWFNRRFLKDDSDVPDVLNDAEFGGDDSDADLNALQAKLTPNHRDPGIVESLGPGTFMVYGNELVYLPFNSMRNLNMNPEWLWRW